MKKILKYVSLACASIFALSACNDDEDIIKLDPSTFVTSKLETPASTTFVLSEDKATTNALTFKWSAAEYGVTTTPNYSLEIDKKGNNFKKAKVITSTSALSYVITVKDLNVLAIDLGIEPFKEGELEYRIVSSLGNPSSQELITNSIAIKVTPYPTDLSTNWGVVGDFTDWGGKPDVQFWKTDKTNVLVAYIDITTFNGDGVTTIKIRQDNKWTLDYGDNEPVDGKLDKGGKNINIAKLGSYKVTFDTANLTYKIEEFTWGLVGDATPNGWGGPDTKLTYDGKLDAWTTVVTMKDGEYKFRQNNKWDVNYGGTATAGILTDKDGANIKIKAGKYKITANFNKLTYTVEAQ